MVNCPKCGSPRIHRSHSRTVVEKLRRTLTGQRPHRCEACGWRGWGTKTSGGVAEVFNSTHVRPAPDLQALDEDPRR